ATSSDIRFPAEAYSYGSPSTPDCLGTEKSNAMFRVMQPYCRALVGASFIVLACDPPDKDPQDTATGAGTGPGAPERLGPCTGHPAIIGARCAPVAEPARFALSASDANTGSIGLGDVARRVVRADLALAQTDVGTAFAGQYVYGLNRL